MENMSEYIRSCYPSYINDFKCDIKEWRKQSSCEAYVIDYEYVAVIDFPRDIFGDIKHRYWREIRYTRDNGFTSFITVRHYGTIEEIKKEVENIFSDI